MPSFLFLPLTDSKERKATAASMNIQVVVFLLRFMIIFLTSRSFSRMNFKKPTKDVRDVKKTTIFYYRTVRKII